MKTILHKDKNCKALTGLINKDGNNQPQVKTWGYHATPLQGIYAIILLLFLCISSGKAQLTLTLDRTITLAADSSLDAFRYKNMYLAGYWPAQPDGLPQLPGAA